MNIVVGSAWRNSAHNVSRYFAQIQELKKHAGAAHTVSVIAAEGDSSDYTRLALHEEARRTKTPLRVMDTSFGTPHFTSTEQPERMAALSQVGNQILNGVNYEDDVLVYVESDLLWNVITIGSLIDCAMQRRDGIDVIAPLIFAGEYFYDIWAYRKNGQRFSPFVPYHPELSPNGITEVDSVGSCLVMRSEVARRVRMTNGALVEWCETARQCGYRIGVHAEFKVRHP